MSGRFKLSIDNPCSQKWSDFEDRGDRGFCSSCQKEVVDFTRMSDSEIRMYFNDRPKNVCGQFKSYQMRTYSNFEAKPSFSRWLSWPIAASALLFTSVHASAQEKDKSEFSQKILSTGLNKSLGLRQVEGVIKDEQGEPLPGVNVFIKGTTLGVVTNMNGYYNIEIPINECILVYSSIGSMTQEVTIKGPQVSDLTMIEDLTQLGGIVVGGAGYYSRWYTPRGLYNRTRGFFKRLF